MTSETREQSAYRQIKKDILEGRIRPDTVLSERELAEDLGISRTPLRSAISRLERENVIGRLNTGALLVRAVSVEQLMEIVQLRQALEVAAAARAATFGVTPVLIAMREVMANYAKGANVAFDDFWHEDERFHLAVAEAAQLTLLPAILAEQRAVARRCTITRTHDLFADQALEHIAVIDAIAARDAAAARTAMSNHFENVRTRFLSRLARS